jgi:hypothetical protein
MGHSTIGPILDTFMEGFMRDINNPAPAVFREMQIPNLTEDTKPKKMIVINNCGQCPLWNRCDLVRERFLDPLEIDTECPLTDYREASNL